MATHWGQHPDLTEGGDLRADTVFSTAPASARDYDRLYAQNYEQATALLARRQSELPLEIQTYVQGRTYAGATPSEGLKAYEEELAWAKVNYAQRRGFGRFITDADVDRMTLQQYDDYFDAAGRPKEDVLLWKTSRSQIPSDGTDETTISEMRNLRGPRR
jgi:hypothetical protein